MKQLHTLPEVAPAFVEMAHRIVWASAATVDTHGRPRTRILHPIWEWDGGTLTGWIATSPTPLKRAHLNAHPYMSLNYWAPTHDTCAAECGASLLLADDVRERIWKLFLHAPVPVGYNPAIIAAWTSPTAAAFAVIKLTPWRLRVMPGSLMAGKGGQLLTWEA